MIKDFLRKIFTVKGIFFITILVLALMGKLEGYYVFIAGSVWVGSRELFKNLDKFKK